MKLFIPELGTELTLAKDWTFTVWPERRNETLVKLVSTRNKASFLHTWEKGTKLTVDRIYIRKGAEGFSSVTFKTIVNKKTIRFWASLGEVNKIEISDSKLEPKTEKWPNGKFTWVRCQTRNWSDTLKKYEYIGEHRWSGWGYAPMGWRNKTVNIFEKTSSGIIEIAVSYDKL